MKDLILEIPDFIPKDLCEHLIEKFELDKDNQTKSAIVYDNKRHIIPELKNSIELYVTLVKNWKYEDNKIQEYMVKLVHKYKEFLKNNFENGQRLHMFSPIINFQTGDAGYTIQKQTRETKYGWHYDGSPVDGKELLFVIIYLNTLEPGEGGETEFINGKKVRPECGKAVIFPASWTYPHCGNKVMADSKYILTTVISVEKS
jgi:hypothetical protein